MRLLNKPVWLSGIKPRSWWNVITMSIVALMIASSIGSLYFIYTNIYRTLSDAEIVFGLNDTGAMESIDLDTFRRVADKLEQKNNLKMPPTALRNMFDFNSLASSSPHATTTSKR